MIGSMRDIGHNEASRSENVQKKSHVGGKLRAHDEKNGHKEEKSRKYIQNNEKLGNKGKGLWEILDIRKLQEAKMSKKKPRQRKFKKL